jgi:hypothetical protein
MRAFSRRYWESALMSVERDAMKVVRAELCERLAAMQTFARRSSLRDLAESIGTFRTMAAAYGLTPVVRLTEALERAMAEDMSERTARCPTSLYLERLQDAIGCDCVDEQSSQAMIASVSIRLSA